MSTVEDRIQNAVLSLEAGELARLVWKAVFIFVAIGLSVFYLIYQFRGLPISQSMDQAQIGREILRGHGWQTKVIRPLAIGELRRHGKDVPKAIQEDTYNAPIPPLLDAAAIYIPIKAGWDLKETDLVYAGDRAIACMGVIFFLASLVVLYFIAADLFDQRLACMAVGLVLICDMMWRYSLSGLPQMFLLLLFHLNVWGMLRAMRRRYLNEPHLGWVAAVGFGFGLMALTHALSIFIFVPVLLFSFIFFKPRGTAGLVMLGVFLAVYTPWLVRNAMVCGDFRGIGWVSALDGVVHSESGHMRRFDVDLAGVYGNYYAGNFRTNIVTQINRLIEYMGWIIVAPVALVSVLHAFRRPVTATFRWLLFAMWISAVCGMSLYGMKQEGPLSANQFHLLFVPLFTCYGLAYVLVQWDRRIGLGFLLPQWSDRSGVHYFLRRSLIIVIFAISSMPLLGRMLLDKTRWYVEWPPYLPPYISVLQKLFAPNEIIASDMPWAVAWYGDRRSLWLPYKVDELIAINDYKQLGGPVSAFYLTPVSGTQNLMEDIVNGEYREWFGYIVRVVDLTKSPYPVKRFLGGLPDCVLYMDKERRLPGK